MWHLRMRMDIPWMRGGLGHVESSSDLAVQQNTLAYVQDRTEDS